jgi:hypothetical protein
MTIVISARTAAATSHSFAVQRGETVGVTAYGLDDAETVTIQKQNGDNTWSNCVGDGAVLTATVYQSRIQASGIYRLVKTLTVAAAGADID